MLSARGIPHTLRRHGAGWRLFVPRRWAEEALAEIQAYARERSQLPLPDPEAAPLRPPVWFPVLVVVGLLTAVFGLILGNAAPFGYAIPWRRLGAGDSTAMLAGQWWRAATSLCLHADPAHLIGNAVIGGLFLVLLCRETGVGLGFALCLAAGVSGNVFKALAQGPGQHFLGASTAVFGALGALGGARLAEGWTAFSFRRAAPAGAALMLLAMLGVGSEEGGAVDLAGHLFGFLSGAVMGLAAGGFLDRRGRPGPAGQRLAGLCAAAGLIGAWWWALASWPGR